jgi:serine/threonine protein kinase/TolB-like protein
VADISERLSSALAGRYTIERELGRGGMAVVYLAHDEKHQRLVALKVMLPEVVGQDGAERFRREIQIAARLTHPNILAVFDSGEAGDTVFYVMPFVEGESARDAIIRERQLGIIEAVTITRQIADALDYAHAQGVIHRDIKPANIMLQRSRTRTGGSASARTPIVADFGIARAMTSDSGTRLTRTGLMVGTPMYMSPEQWAGEHAVDGRSDQYSLACVLYEMLIGEPPFGGATPMVVLARHTQEPVPSLRLVRPTIPDMLEQVIYRALAKVPADRFATMGEVADALAIATEGPIDYGGNDRQYFDPSQPRGDYNSGPRTNPSYNGPRSFPSYPTQPRGNAYPYQPPPGPRSYPSYPSGQQDPRSYPSGQQDPRSYPSHPAAVTGPNSDPSLSSGPRSYPPANTPPKMMATGFVDVSAKTSTFERPTTRKSRVWMIVGALAATIAIAAGITWRALKPTVPERTRLVVLPFENRGPVRDSAFADGLTEEIISRLSGIQRLGVVARASAMKYKDSPKRLKEIAQELNVDRLITGRVNWNGNSGDVRDATVTVTIVDANTEEEQALTEISASNLDNLYTIASQVAAKLNIKVDERERSHLDQKPTANPEAFDAYQLGNRFINLSWDSTNVKAALVNYERAAKLDGRFALALAGVGRTHAWLYQLGIDPSEARLTFARQYIDSALTIAPDLPEAHLALGLLHYWGKRDYDRALSEFRLVQNALPSNAEVFLQTANVQRRKRAFQEAAKNYELASELDPKAYQPWFSGAEALLYIREYDEAERRVARATELQPDFLDNYILKATLRIHRAGGVVEARRILADVATRIPPARWRPEGHHWRAGLFRIVDDSIGPALRRIAVNTYGLDSANYLLSRAGVFDQFGRSDSARVYYDRAAAYMKATVDRHPESAAAHGQYGLALAGLKRADDAIREAERGASMLNEETDALDGPEWVVNVAQVYTLLGNKQKAIEWLTRAMKTSSRLSPKWIELDPVWTSLRGEPAFQQLVRNPPPLSNRPIAGK